MNIFNKIELKLLRKRIDRKIKKGRSVMIVYHMSAAVFRELNRGSVVVRHENRPTFLGENGSKYTIRLDAFI